ncbi:MAG TPA: peptidase U32 family protein, partial [Candidatus Nanoarchaeia archaeon]|nr:peptidase U32 family protein [Candidatus Nanoarchaeia archaeon]
MELLAPAGDWESLRAGIEAKADAIYFGIKKLNMRVKTKNFEFSDIKKISTICHKNKIKCYLTLNTIVFDKELKDIENIIKKAKESQIDAIICWDLAVVNMANKYKIPIHLSTQASVANSKSLELYKKLGIKRVILARELSLKQIKNIKTDL